MIQLNARNYAWNKRKHDTAQHSCVRHLGNALDKRDWRWHLTSAFSQRLRKYTFTAVHTKTHKRRFQIYPLWRAFSNLCVYGERFHRLRVDGRPKRIKKFAFTSVCVCNRLRVDGASGTASFTLKRFLTLKVVKTNLKSTGLLNRLASFRILLCAVTEKCPT